MNFSPSTSNIIKIEKHGNEVQNKIIFTFFPIQKLIKNLISSIWEGKKRHGTQLEVEKENFSEIKLFLIEIKAL